MAETVGFASALLSLTALTLSTSKSLYEAISSFKSQRKTIKDLQTDIHSLVTVLETIQIQAQTPQEVEKLKPLRNPLEHCLATCQDISDMVDACMKHSATGRDSVRAWLNMRYHEKSFDDMKQRLVSYKSTLSITFGAISMMDHSSTQDSLDDLRDSICGTKEDLEDQLSHLQEMMSAMDKSKRDYLHADQARLQRSLENLEQAQSIADTSRPEVTVSNNRSNDESRAIFGTDTSHPRFSLNVSNNDVGLGAVAAAGVHTPETLQALLRCSQASNLALAFESFQADHTPSQGAHNCTLKSVRHELSMEPSEVSRQISLRISEETDKASPIDSPTHSVNKIHAESVPGEEPVGEGRMPYQLSGKK